MLSSDHLNVGSPYVCFPASTVTFFDALYSLPSIVAVATYVTSPPFSQSKPSGFSTLMSVVLAVFVSSCVSLFWSSNKASNSLPSHSVQETVTSASVLSSFHVAVAFPYACSAVSPSGRDDCASKHFVHK